jgi:hypothetical protein
MKFCQRFQRDERDKINLGKVLAQASELPWEHGILREDRFKPMCGHEESTCIA